MEFKTLFTPEDIAQRIKGLSSEIVRHYDGVVTARGRRGHDGFPITMMPVLNGSMLFAADLIRQLQCSYLLPELHPIRIKSYVGQQSQELTIHSMGNDTDLAGKDVLVVEDILDTGQTLTVLLDYLKNACQVASVTVAVLLDKGKSNLKADFTAFVCPDKFVVGYGLDIDEKYRGLPYIGYK